MGSGDKLDVALAVTPYAPMLQEQFGRGVSRDAFCIYAVYMFLQAQIPNPLTLTPHSSFIFQTQKIRHHTKQIAIIVLMVN